MSAIDIPGYKIIRTLGVGGQATVYLAIQQGFDREVALKVMSPALAADPTFGERFIREAKIVAKLSHKNIVTVYDVGESGNFYYLAMEYLPGEELKERISNGLKTKECVSIIANIAKALNFAHDKGYIHRDVKSENILFNEDNEPVLTDFGIAKASNSSTQMTQTGKLIGTPEYMSPEQCRGKKVDGRSDLYSLGIILYEMLTRRVPFTGEDSVAVCIQHVTKPLPQLPVRLKHFQWLLNQLLDKDPDKRFQSGKELASALVEFSRSGKETRVTQPDIAKTTQLDQKDIEAELNTNSEIPDDFDDLHTEKRTHVSIVPVEEANNNKLRKVFIVAVLLIGSGVAAVTHKSWFPQANEWFAVNVLGEEKVISDAAYESLSSTKDNTLSKQKLVTTGENERKDPASLLQEADALVQFTPQRIDDIKKALKLVATVKTLEPENSSAQLINQNILSTSLMEATALAEKGDFEEAELWVALVAYEDPQYKLLSSTKETIARLKQEFDNKKLSREKQQESVASLISQGNDALLNKRLSSPVDNNAIMFFEKALSLEPDNQEAIDGLKKVAAEYQALIEQAIEDKSFSQAKTFLSRFNQLSDDQIAKNSLRQKIIQAEKAYIKEQEAKKRQIALAEKAKQEEAERQSKLNDPIVQMKLLGSLDSAKNFESQGILVMPEENNALAKYRKVLEIDERNQEAQNGIKRIEETIKKKLTEYIAQNNKLEATQWLTRLKLFQDEHPEYNSFQSAVDSIIEPQVLSEDESFPQSDELQDNTTQQLIEGEDKTNELEQVGDNAAVNLPVTDEPLNSMTQKFENEEIKTPVNDEVKKDANVEVLSQDKGEDDQSVIQPIENDPPTENKPIEDKDNLEVEK